MLSLSVFTTSYAPTIVAPAAPMRAAVVMQEDAPAPAPASSNVVQDLKDLSVKCNPIVGYWDPFNIPDIGETETDKQATIGWFRHAEIKHGRVAMAAFVGFCAQSNGITFPWALTGGSFGGETVMFTDIAAAGGPGAQWDALPTASKFQILGAIGILEAIGELSPVTRLGRTRTLP